MPTVLILYPGSVTFRQEQMAQHRPLLRELGIKTVLGDDFVQDSDRDFFDDVVALPACDRVVEGWRILERWLDAHAVDAVLAQSEPAILLGALAARKLGRPGPSPEAALKTVSKLLTRRGLERARVPQPGYALARTEREARAFADAHGYPIVLKATASALGRLVTLVRSPSELEAAVALVRAGLPASTDVVRLVDFGLAAGIDLGYDPLTEFLVETYAPGDPVETDGVLHRKEPLTFGVTAQVLTPPPLFFVEGYLLPADLPAPGIDAIERVSDAALAALGLSDTGYSIEMRVSDGRPLVIEVNGRLGWDEGFGDLFEVRTGLQPAFACLQVALGARPEFLRREDVRCAVAYLSSFEDGVVAKLPADEDVRALERRGFRAGLAVHEGERTYAPPHPDVTPHLAWTLATDPRSSRAAYERARNAVRELRFAIEPARS
jgi:biotin carboxylase